MTPRAMIFGCEGLVLSARERSFFADCDPLGFILFQRNCDSPGQVRRLVDSLREAVGRAEAPILIDQEGGRVQRLRPPHWRAAPAAALFGRLQAENPATAREACRINSQLIGLELAELGIDVDCHPVMDVPQSGAHDVIGDRAFAADPEEVIPLAAAAAAGLLAAGVLPILKHIPGHGRAVVDSHKALPRVAATREGLEQVDFAPFRALAALPWAMTAHVIYEALDPQLPATLSPRVIAEVIRRDIGFQGLLLTDDLSMEALSGDFATRTSAALQAGCDLVLHCNGKAGEMAAVADAAGIMEPRAWQAFLAGRRLAAEKRDSAVEKADLEARFAALTRV